jgi:hypothetical protein
MPIISLIVIISYPCHAADYFVDADGGNDSDSGTITYPWKTIAKVEVSTGPNDRVFFQRGDVWRDTLDVPASNMIFDAYGTGSKPTIDGENTRVTGILVSGWHDVTIRNFNIKNTTNSGVQFSSWRDRIAYNLSLINSDFTDMKKNGVQVYVPYDVRVDGLLPYGVTIRGNTFTNLGNFAIGLYVTDTSPTIISENVVTHAGNGTSQTNALQVAGKGIIIEKNIVLDTKGGPAGDGHAIILDWYIAGDVDTASENVTVRYNYVSGSNLASGQSGINLWYCKNCLVYGNISVNNSIGYKIANQVSSGCQFYNNVAYLSTREGADIYSTAPVSIWKNNIFYGRNNNDTAIAVFGETPVESNNIFYNFTKLTNQPDVLKVSAADVDPLFNNPEINDFSLQFGSPAIDGGADLTSIVDGLVLPGSIPPDNLVTVEAKDNNIFEIGAYAFVEAVQGNVAPSMPVLVAPENNTTLEGGPLDFIWEKSTDPNHDIVTYYLYYCQDPNFINCNPIVVDTNTTGVVYAESIGGMFLIGITIIGGTGRKKKFSPAVAAIILISWFSIISSCEVTHGTFDGLYEVKYTASDIMTGTTYYWKVVADDSNGGKTQSAVWSFSKL